MARRISIKGQRRALKKSASFIEGTQELTRRLTALGAAGGKEAVPVVIEWGKEAKAEVLSRTPLGPTGNLRRGIFLDARDPFHDPAGPSVIVGINHNIAPHWHFLELGSSRQKPEPFFRPGIRASRKRGEAIVKSGLKKIVEAKR